MSSTTQSRKAPFKGRPATELISFSEGCLRSGQSISERLDGFKELTAFLLDMDSDCNPKLEIEKSTSSASGLTPEAMVEKMDLLLEVILRCLGEGISEEFYIGLLELFEESVLKLYQPHYVQFITYFAASASKTRADEFLSLLLNIVHDASSDSIARREGIGFIASFVCRAKFLGWTHSARTAKYLVSFMHSLDITRSSSDRMLFILSLQAVCYMVCWECSRWKDHVLSSELDWVWRSKKGLIPLLNKTKQVGVLRLVSHDILTMMYPLCGRISAQLKMFVGEAIATYKQLLPPLWKFVNESKLARPNFPFDPVFNLPRTCPLILPLIREWEEPGKAPDAPDVPAQSFTTDEESLREESEAEKEADNTVSGDVWNYHSIRAALGNQVSPFMCPGDLGMLMCSPLLESQSTDPSSFKSDSGENLVLNRILTSSKFAPAPVFRLD